VNIIDIEGRRADMGQFEYFHDEFITFFLVLRPVDFVVQKMEPLQGYFTTSVKEFKRPIAGRR
jgi:hypothetical protein